MADGRRDQVRTQQGRAQSRFRGHQTAFLTTERIAAGAAKLMMVVAVIGRTILLRAQIIKQDEQDGDDRDDPCDESRMTLNGSDIHEN